MDDATVIRSPLALLRVAGLIAICFVAVPAKAAPSEAGRLIAFEDDGDLYVISSNGTGRRQLTEGFADDHDIAWSPDGRRLAFVRDIRVGMDRGDWVTRPVIYVVGVDGSGLLRLSPRRVLFDEDPMWSPNGRQIVFTRNVRSDTLGDIWLMNADGTGARRLTRHVGWIAIRRGRRMGAKSRLTARGPIKPRCSS